MAPTRRVAAQQDRSGEAWNLVERFIRHRRLALLSGVLAASLGLLYSCTYQPVYHAEAQVRIVDSLDARLSPGQHDEAADAAELPETLASAFRARFLLDPKLEALLQELSAEPVLAHLPQLKTAAGRADLIEHIKQHVQVEPVTRRVFRVLYDGHDPVLVQRIAQRLAELGVKDVVAERDDTAHKARAFLTGETTIARQAMLDSEIQVVRFLRAHPNLMLAPGAEHNKLGLGVADKLLLGREQAPGLSPLQALEAADSPAMRGLLAQRAEVTARIAQIETAQKFEPVQGKVNEIDRLQQQLADLKAQNYSSEYPEYQRIERDIDRLRQEISDSKSRRDSALSADMQKLDDARSRQAALDHQIALLRQKAQRGADVPDEQALSAETEYARLTRDMEIARTSYEKLHERELDAQMNEELGRVKGNLAAQVDEPARLPAGPRGVGRGVMAALCVLLGLALGALVGLLRALTDPRILTVFDLARASKLPVLGRVPRGDGTGSLGRNEVSGEIAEGARTRLPAELGKPAPAQMVASQENADTSQPAAAPQLGGAQRSGAPFSDSTQRSGAPFSDSAQRSGAPFSDDYMVVYATQNEAGTGQVVASALPGAAGPPRVPDGRPTPRAPSGNGQAGSRPAAHALSPLASLSSLPAPTLFNERSRSALLSAPQSAAFRLVSMGHSVRQGQLPKLDDLFLLSAPDGARAEQYRLLRCRLQEQDDPRVLLITSAQPGEGKTTAALNLALAFAEGGAHSVVMVDAHLGAPRMTELLGAEARTEALVDPDALSHGLEVWQYTPNLFLVPTLGPRSQRSAVLSSPAFAMLIADLRQTFDYVILDSPAVASAADAKLILRSADAGLFLAQAGTATSHTVAAALSRLGRRAMAGAVLSEFAPAALGPGVLGISSLRDL